MSSIKEDAPFEESVYEEQLKQQREESHKESASLRDQIRTMDSYSSYGQW